MQGEFPLEYAVIILLIVVVVVVLLKMKSGSQQSKRSASKQKIQSRKAAVAQQRRAATPENNYAAVSISCKADACQSAQTLAGQRFLANEVPTFPLPGCDSANCSCKYVHHTARRDHDEDRRAPSSLKTNLFEDSGNVERRKGRQRRTSDPR